MIKKNNNMKLTSPNGEAYKTILGHKRCLYCGKILPKNCEMKLCFKCSMRKY